MREHWEAYIFDNNNPGDSVAEKLVNFTIRECCDWVTQTLDVLPKNVQYRIVLEKVM